ncbi:MAG: DUF4347 domain-containing protein, partial [Planctomycetes bacterium]|nr:DUF4347 domain-containing protein [Planctomycetota bacterium]
MSTLRTQRQPSNLKHTRIPRTKRPILERLEDRVVLSPVLDPFQPIQPAIPNEPLRVVLISDAVPEPERVAAAALPGVTAVIYDSDTTGFDQMIAMLDSFSARYGGAKIEQLGLVTHGHSASVTIGAAESLSLNSLQRNSDAWDRLRSLLATDARLDLFACSVAAGPLGESFVDALAVRTGATVYASDDVVGSGDLGDYQWEDSTAGGPGQGELLSIAALEAIVGFALEDAYEPNDTKTEVDGRPEGAPNSANLGRLVATTIISNLALDDGADWFKFRTDGVSTAAHLVRIDFLNANGNLDLYVYRENGTTLIGASGSAGNFEQVSLAGERSGTFYAVVVPQVVGGRNPAYTLQIVPPADTSDDAFEENDGKTIVDAQPVGVPNSPNLGLLTSLRSIPNLVLDDAADWYRFETSGVSTTAHSVRIDFQNADGNLDLYVYRQDGTTLVGASGSPN